MLRGLELLLRRWREIFYDDDAGDDGDGDDTDEDDDDHDDTDDFNGDGGKPC